MLSLVWDIAMIHREDIWINKLRIDSNLRVIIGLFNNFHVKFAIILTETHIQIITKLIFLMLVFLNLCMVAHSASKEQQQLFSSP